MRQGARLFFLYLASNVGLASPPAAGPVLIGGEPMNQMVLVGLPAQGLCSLKPQDGGHQRADASWGLVPVGLGTSPASSAALGSLSSVALFLRLPPSILRPPNTSLAPKR
jgi:hypothetical protein